MKLTLLTIALAALASACPLSAGADALGGWSCHLTDQARRVSVGPELAAAMKDVFPGHDGHIILPGPDEMVRLQRLPLPGWYPYGYCPESAAPEPWWPPESVRLHFQTKGPAYEIHAEGGSWSPDGSMATLTGRVEVTAGQEKYRLAGDTVTFSRTDLRLRVIGHAQILQIEKTGPDSATAQGGQAVDLTLNTAGAPPEIVVR